MVLFQTLTYKTYSSVSQVRVDANNGDESQRSTDLGLMVGAGSGASAAPSSRLWRMRSQTCECEKSEPRLNDYLVSRSRATQSRAIFIEAPTDRSRSSNESAAAGTDCALRAERARDLPWPSSASPGKAFHSHHRVIAIFERRKSQPGPTGSEARREVS